MIRPSYKTYNKNLNLIKFFLIFILFLFFNGCSKKNGIPNEQQLQKDTTQSSNSKKDTTRTSKLKKDSTSSLKTIKDTVKAIPLPYEQSEGKFIFNRYCSVCHGEQGKGNGFNAFNLNPKPKNFTDSNYISKYNDARLLEVIDKGGKGVNKSPMMPAYGGTLSKDDLEYVAKYIRYLSAQKRN